MARGRIKSLNQRFLIQIFIIVGLFIVTSFIFKEFVQATKQKEDTASPATNQTNIATENNPVETYTDIKIAAAGDIMFHDTQLISAYDEETETYDFKSVFEDIKPIISEADLAIANFETTTSGVKPFKGYPVFNSPDEVVDAIKYAGFDVLSTANNHSLDTGSDGLKRTVETIQNKNLGTIGTYNEAPTSRVLMKDVKGIKIAFLSYTETINYGTANYSSDDLNAMINIMEKDRITVDVQEAKELGADVIIAFMHWGNEYEEHPSSKQLEYSQFLAEQGIDIVLGSHPHVIQKSDYIEVGGKKTFVVYSMGNFISNQRKETLSSENELTEDGVIVNLNIRKDTKTNEISIEEVEYVPTWVYRDEAEQSKFTYRILPIENFLDDVSISEEFKERMNRSLEATTSKMEPTLVISK